MTALEEQLTKALRRLSAQYETEQQRQSGQVEALRRRVRAAKRGERSLAAARRAARAGRTKPCGCESSGWTGK